MKSHVRANEIEKEDENRDSRVSGIEIVKAAFGFIPRLETVVERFNEIVGNIVGKALDPNNMVSIREKTFDRDIVSRVAVTDNAVRRTKLFCMIQNRVSLWGIAMW